jgi:plasmid replication initiation protein
MLVIEVVELIIRAGLCQELAEACAIALESRPAGTWVRLRALESWQYAENGPATRPVFVELILADWPDTPDQVLAKVAAAVAACLDRPVEWVHVLLQPPARGRVAFGGQLLPG